MICIALFGLCFTAANAQPYHKLTIDDFQGMPNYSNGEVVAFTNCSIEYGYTAKPEKNYYVLNFNVRVLMDNDQSWMDKHKIYSAEMMAEVLKHEQGHYNLAYLEQQELLRTVSHTVFYANYRKVAQNIFDRVDAKYQQLNLDYDNDTQHMTNREQQHSWDMFFKKHLELEYLARN